MSDTPCAVDGCPRPAGAHGICAVDRVALTDALAAFPWLVQQLHLTVTRQTAIAGGSSAGEGEGLVFAREEADLLWVVRNTCDAWAHALDASGMTWAPYERPSTAYAAGARYLHAYLSEVLRMPELPQLVGEFVALAHACERAIDRPGERVYVGPCDEDGRDLYAYPDQDTVKCRCGKTFDVWSRRLEMLEAAEERLLPAVDVSRALTTLGVEVTPERIRQWQTRGKLHPVPGPWGGRAMYRVGDVRALLSAS